MTDPAPIHDRPRILRTNQTEPERVLWLRLRRRQLGNLKFRRQHPVAPFVADFCCIERRLVIELDGEQHEMRQPQDAERTAFLETRGFQVIRFSNFEVRDDIGSVLERILTAAGHWKSEGK